MDDAAIPGASRPATTSNAVHSYNVRICHWINVVACAYLLLSGVHIFLDFPELYWGHTGYRGYPAAFRLSDWGLAWVFLINGLVYVGWNLYSRHFHHRMLPARDELTTAHVQAELRDQFRRRPGRRPSHGSYRTLQKTSYLILIFVFVPLMILTGIAQSPGFTAALPALLDMFGGRQSARTLHTIGTAVLVLFVVVHVLEVAAAGFVNAVRSMITGK